MSLFQVANRPKAFSEVLGQDKAIKALQTQYASKRFPSAIMFAGSPGTGKTTLARIVAVSLCRGIKEFGEPTAEDWKAWDELCILEVNGALQNKVDDANQIVQHARFAPNFPSKKRVIIFDEAHRLTPQAQEILLKPLEDAGSTVWLICTTEPGKFKEAIRRRCYKVEMAGLDSTGIKQLLASAIRSSGQKKVNLSEFYAKLIERKVSSPGWILNSLERFLAGMPVSEAVDTGEVAEEELFPAVQALARGDWPGVSKNLPAKWDIDAARAFRAISCAYLKSVLMRTGKQNVAKAILEFQGTLGYDDTILASTVLAAASLACGHLSSGNATRTNKRW